MPPNPGAWLALAVVALQAPAAIPRTWDAAEVADFELPLAVPEFTPRHVPEDYYYRLPVRPARLRPDYRPTGFPGLGGSARAVPGHRYGLSLNARDRDALIAFLKTL